jgi:hypothetical protein
MPTWNLTSSFLPAERNLATTPKRRILNKMFSLEDKYLPRCDGTIRKTRSEADSWTFELETATRPREALQQISILLLNCELLNPGRVCLKPWSHPCAFNPTPTLLRVIGRLRLHLRNLNFGLPKWIPPECCLMLSISALRSPWRVLL